MMISIDGSNDNDSSLEVVYQLEQKNGFDELEEGNYYHAKVDRLVKYGMFVRLSRRISGLIHESNYDKTYAVGERIVAELISIKENGDLSFSPKEISEYKTQVLGGTKTVDIKHLEDHIGGTVKIEGIVSRVKQTSGPLIYSISDGTGVIGGVEMGRNNKHIRRIGSGESVQIVGTVRQGKYGTQIEIDHIDVLEDKELEKLIEKYEKNISDQIGFFEEDFLLDWPALNKLREGIESSARMLIRSVFEGRPIIVRHHSDVDGICAGVPIEKALKMLVEKVHKNKISPHNLIKRLPSKAPYYEMEDVVKDLDMALSFREKHGQMLPLILLIDNGSTEEDIPAYEYLHSYEIPIIVVDHHYPSAELVDPHIKVHVNPYIVGEDYRITTGMICSEIARMIFPEIGYSFGHLATISGISDRSSSNAMEDYFRIAEELGFQREELDKICESLDYVTYILRYDNGDNFIEDILGIGENDNYKKIVDLLSKKASEAIKNQVDTALKYTETTELDNGIKLNLIDIENGIQKRTYPAPGKTTSAIHDILVELDRAPTVTISYGFDFAVIRSDGVDLDIPKIIKEIKNEFPELGLSGGGHLVVGSIRFVPGEHLKIKEILEEKLKKIPA